MSPLLVPEQARRTTLSLLPLGAFETEIDGSWDYVTPTLVEMLGGLPTSSLLGREWLTRVHPDDLPRVVAEYRQAREFRRPWRHDFRMIGADERVRYIGVDANPLPRDPGARGVRYVGLVRDRSGIVRALELAHESQALFEQMQAVAHEGVAIVRGEVILVGNQAAARILGAGSVEELVGIPALSRVHPADHARFEGFGRGTEETFATTRVLRPDGSEETVVVLGRSVVYAGAPARLVTFVPITDAVVQAAVSARNELRLHALEGLLLSPYHRIGLEGMDAGIIEYANPAFCELVGRAEEELVGMSILEITHPDDRALTERSLRAFAESEGQGPSRMVKRFLRPDGSEVVAELRSTIYRDPVTGRAVSMTMFRDLAEPTCCREMTAESHQERSSKQAERKAQTALQGGNP
ncbi:MAG: PAS domain-containing protein [Candidatus Nanopelagicales bacterium]